MTEFDKETSIPGDGEEDKHASKDRQQLDSTVFALLFASDEPLSMKRISGVLDETSPETSTPPWRE